MTTALVVPTIDYFRNRILCTDALTLLNSLPDIPPYCGIIESYKNTVDTMTRDEKGRFTKGSSGGKETQFKKGQHWREPKPFWNRDWLLQEYVFNQRSTGDIAAEFDTTDANILYWLKKHGIDRRSISEARKVKQWGLSGETNGMYGRAGKDNPNWRGGVSPDRQALYSSPEWAKASKAVWKRDNGTCQRCKRHYTKAGKMHIHHIVSFAVVELRAVVSNLILLCQDCHQWVHSKENADGEFLADE